MVDAGVGIARSEVRKIMENGIIGKIMDWSKGGG